jgi:hypothetical protein
MSELAGTLRGVFTTGAHVKDWSTVFVEAVEYAA